MASIRLSDASKVNFCSSPHREGALPVILSEGSPLLAGDGMEEGALQLLLAQHSD